LTIGFFNPILVVVISIVVLFCLLECWLINFLRLITYFFL
jgi:hypothetical protein